MRTGVSLSHAVLQHGHGHGAERRVYAEQNAAPRPASAREGERQPKDAGADDAVAVGDAAGDDAGGRLSALVRHPHDDAAVAGGGAPEQGLAQNVGAALLHAHSAARVQADCSLRGLGCVAARWRSCTQRRHRTHRIKTTLRSFDREGGQRCFSATAAVGSHS
eukprot:COSAG06_NODE_2137_length_7501_cov_84.008376_3_plen_163_part_00